MSPTFQDVDIVHLVGAKKAVTLETATVVLDGSLSLSVSAVARLFGISSKWS